jgi:hypothetical protein
MIGQIDHVVPGDPPAVPYVSAGSKTRWRWYQKYVLEVDVFIKLLWLEIVPCQDAVAPRVVDDLLL